MPYLFAIKGQKKNACEGFYKYTACKSPGVLGKILIISICSQKTGGDCFYGAKAWEK